MPDRTDQATQVAQAARRSGTTVAVAESLTSGALASALGAAPHASEWFRGGVVAYATEVKHDLLQVPPGPVVSEPAVLAMAERAGALLGAEVTLAVSGAGGPEPQDGQPVGTVWFAIHLDGHTSSACFRFDGGPQEVVHQAVERGLLYLLEAVEQTGPAARSTAP